MTQRREEPSAEERLRKSEALLAEAQQVAHIGNWEWDIPGNKVTWSDELYRIYGLEPQEFEATYEGFLDRLHPDDRKKIDETVQLTYREKDSFEFDHRVVRPDGSVRWMHGRGRVERDSDGNPVRMYGTGQDITEWKLAREELQRRARELARSNEELEQFAYVASHDLREPLRMVYSYVQLLEKRYKEALDEQARKYIQYAVDGARRMDRMIRDLLAYSRVRTERNSPEAMDVNEVFQDVRDNLSRILAERKGIVEADPLPVLRIDRVQMTELLQNLVENGIKYNRSTPPEVRVEASQNGDEILFSVRDNGIGIEPESFERIFRLFQRLQTFGEFPGTGMGLAICRKIVEFHGGRIWVESEPGNGSTFFFTLPKPAG